jgi:hypothetical protein
MAKKIEDRAVDEACGAINRRPAMPYHARWRIDSDA